MPRTLKSREEVLGKIQSLVNENLPTKQAALVSAFAAQYFENVALEDLNARSVADLYGAMLSHWNLIFQRAFGETKIHVYNPNFEEHGWQSAHTVVEVSIDDMPFLVDSMRLEINRQGYDVHFMVHLGAVKLKRDAKNQVIAVLPHNANEEGMQLEAPIYIEIDRESDPDALQKLEAGLFSVVADVRLAVQDWLKMRERMMETVENLKNNPPPFDKKEIDESVAFLEWLNNDHFTYLGCRDYELVQTEEGEGLALVKNSGLGVLRREEKSKQIRLMSSMPPAARALAESQEILIVSKTNTLSTIHRNAYSDYIGVKMFDKNGKLTGERRFIGLFTSTAYKSYPQEIPLLRRKMTMVMHESKLSPFGHSGKELNDILASLPRDDLFQATVSELTELALGILHVQERQQIHLFVRQDAYRRFVSCLVFVPREQLNTELRQLMQTVLEEAFKAIEVNFFMHFSEAMLARVDFIIRVDPNIPLVYDVEEIQAKLIEVSRSWKDDLQVCVLDHFGEEEGIRLMRKYGKSFPAAYREDFSPHIAVYDLVHMERLSAEHDIEMNLYTPLDALEGELSFKLFKFGASVILSDVLPMLKNMGLRVISERPYEIKLKEYVPIWIHSFTMTYAHGLNLEIDTIKDIFQEAFLHLWRGATENDGFNRLVLAAHLTWREAMLLRAYTRYLKQIGFIFSQDYIEDTLAKNAEITKKIVALFQLWFDPERQSASVAAIPELEKELQVALDAVVSLDEDRVLRKLLEVIRATFRTNYFQRINGSEYKMRIAFKFNPTRITDFPLPRPMYEVFVYSPEMDGVHKRTSSVARGGIRWSDRQDFSTEILGLMKAQQVKNAVIVPSGAKGGFLPKALPENGTRDQIMQAGIDCYRIFIRGLLDVTDNLVDGKIVPPTETVRYDGDDPYLVVAADKGTATFSDIANGIAAEYDFWLGDAFASGGSAGYDHKKMAITARGAWESVKRHLRVLNINPEKQDFTVVGIGDMAGDVFGNGMLRSKHIKLVAAFNHAHIFLDPNPDAALSFSERERLFNLPRSSWEDYDKKLISTGGGVFNRALKSILISPEIKTLLGLTQDTMEPNALIRAILMAEVDLLFNGGIGTYVKASNERHVDVGDRANDVLRINGSQLRARSVGEGGNLGFTQLGRIEFALKGGLIYTDFIDNSAGVDCSDHEVNAKILLNAIVANGDMTVKQRNTLLAGMTTEIAELILEDNYNQTRAIDLISVRALEEFDLQHVYVNDLEKSNKLDRALEFLPDEKGFIERKAQGKPLTSPELAILLSYTKIVLKAELLLSDVPEDPYLRQAVLLGFPRPLREKFAKQMEEHRLRREIIVTQLTSKMVNEMGITFVHRMQVESNVKAPNVLRAYVIAQKIFRFDEYFTAIERLDYQVDVTIQYEMMWQVSRLVRRAARWFAVYGKDYLLDIAGSIERFSGGIARLADHMPNLLMGNERARWETYVKTLTEAGVPADLAIKIGTVKYQYILADIVDAALDNQLPVIEFATVYFMLGDHLDLTWLREQISIQNVENQWDVLARSALRDDLDREQRKLAVKIMQASEATTDPAALISKWQGKHKHFYTTWHNMLTELRAVSELTYIMFSVVVRRLMDVSRFRSGLKRRLQKEKII